MIKTILFDIDGVMLSEEHYFDASALTVYEMLHSPRFARVNPDYAQLPKYQPRLNAAEISQIRSTVFDEDAVLHRMKSAGVNANWDMVYLQTAYQITLLLEAFRDFSGARRADGVAAGIDATDGTRAAAGIDATGSRGPDVADSLDAISKVAARFGWGQEALSEIALQVPDKVKAAAVNYAAFTDAMQDCKTKQELFDELERRLAAVFRSERNDDCGGSGSSDCDGGLGTDSDEQRSSVTPFSYGNKLWDLCRDTFQEWYLGDKHYPGSISTGKAGFLENEDALVAPDELRRLFEDCVERGIEIGIATGRPGIETRVPLSTLGWLPCFDPSRISTADDVLVAERIMPHRAPLSKPNPYSYLRSYLKSPSVEDVLGTSLPLSPEVAQSILVVGDSVADLLAAKTLGCKFAGVLTGLAGAAARGEFETLAADYILDNVLAVREVIL